MQACTWHFGLERQAELPTTWERKEEGRKEEGRPTTTTTWEEEGVVGILPAYHLPACYLVGMTLYLYLP